MAAKILTHELLRTILSYNEKTGAFLCAKKYCNKINVGASVGTVGKDTGYVSVTLFGRRYKAHRLAWFYVTGKWPDALIDHKDQDRSNNSFGNLREATFSENNRNCAVRKSNKSGAAGVMWIPDKQRWRAHITLGHFSSKDDAILARKSAEKMIFGEFANIN